MKNLQKIKNKILKETQSVWLAAIAAELGVKSLDIVNAKVNKYNGGTIKKITIDGYYITNIDMDQYNNVEMSIGKMMPVSYLPIFGRILNELYPVEQYNGRANYYVHIKYFEKFNKHLTLDDIKAMFRTGNGWTSDISEGFRSSLLGSFEPEEYHWNKKQSPRPWDSKIPDKYHFTYTQLAALWEPGYRKTYWELTEQKKKEKEKLETA